MNARRYCQVCNAPTDRLVWDMALCEACQDQMADDLSGPQDDYHGPAEQVAAWARDARGALAESYWESHDQLRYEHP